MYKTQVFRKLNRFITLFLVMATMSFFCTGCGAIGSMISNVVGIVKNIAGSILPGIRALTDKLAPGFAKIASGDPMGGAAEVAEQLVPGMGKTINDAKANLTYAKEKIDTVNKTVTAVRKAEGFVDKTVGSIKEGGKNVLNWVGQKLGLIKEEKKAAPQPTSGTTSGRQSVKRGTND
ncbi:hypothetical protein ACFL35_05600 [Candidatus Riflebacteria bacterium]